MCWFCTLYVFVHVVLLTYLYCYMKYTCVCWLAHHVFVFLGLEPLLNLVGILFGSCEGLMDYSVLGECHAWAFHNPKMCVHEENHLVVLLHVYLVSMWYVLLMRNSISIMSINPL